jgi:hypothetical protein
MHAIGDTVPKYKKKSMKTTPPETFRYTKNRYTKSITVLLITEHLHANNLA